MFSKAKQIILTGYYSSRAVFLPAKKNPLKINLFFSSEISASLLKILQLFQREAAKVLGKDFVAVLCP